MILDLLKSFYRSKPIQEILYGPQLPDIPQAMNMEELETIIKRELYPFQKEGVKLIDRLKGRCLLADDTGLGKSIQALTWKLRRKEASPTLIISPAIVKYNWENECGLLGIPARVLSGRSSHGLGKASTYIANYDILADWYDPLIKLGPKLVIIDEAHLLSNPNALRTRAVKGICENADIPYRLALTGTPLVNNPAELWAILNILRPDLWPDYNKFVNRYCVRKRTIYGWAFSEAINMAGLNVRLKKVMVRRRKDDVLKDLPKQVITIVPIDIDNRKLYDHAVKDFNSWLKTYHPAKSNRATTMSQIGYMLRLVAELKRNNVIKWVENFLEGGNKLILYGCHNKTFLDPLHAHFKKSVLINGSVPDKKRQILVDKFNKDKNCPLMLGQIKAASEGWNCTSTSYVAFGELYWNPAKHIQGMNRVRGIARGVKGVAANAYFLVAKDTIEQLLCKMLERKARTSDQAIDGRENISKFGIYTEYIKTLKDAL